MLSHLPAHHVSIITAFIRICALVLCYWNTDVLLYLTQSVLAMNYATKLAAWVQVWIFVLVQMLNVFKIWSPSTRNVIYVLICDTIIFSFRVKHHRLFQNSQKNWEEHRWAGPPRTNPPRRTSWRCTFCPHADLHPCYRGDHKSGVVYLCSWKRVTAASIWYSMTPRTSSASGWKS